jgi:hypothetical protein
VVNVAVNLVVSDAVAVKVVLDEVEAVLVDNDGEDVVVVVNVAVNLVASDVVLDKVVLDKVVLDKVEVVLVDDDGEDAVIVVVVPITQSSRIPPRHGDFDDEIVVELADGVTVVERSVAGKDELAVVSV